ncbi:MAG: hypothetical protein OXH22_06945 [Chloroflexi bacterium]|nr:hypothetical protein [Chloroflexota bacterium]
MNTESENTGTGAFHFQCPYCEGAIRFSVEVFQPPIDDYYSDEKWERMEAEAEMQRQEWEPFFEAQSEMTDLIDGNQYADAVPAIHVYLEKMLERLNAGTEESAYHSFGGSGFNDLVFVDGARILAFMGDVEGLGRMHEIVTAFPDLRRSVSDVEERQREVGMFQAIREAVRDNPNCLQTDVKILINEVDGHHVARLLAFMDKAGEIIRVREGRKIRISLANTSD